MKKLLHLLVLCLSIFVFSGCASMQHNYTPTSKNLDFPKINTKTTAYIGDAMIVQGELITAEFLKTSAVSGGFCYTIPNGEYLKRGADKSKIYFSTNGSNGRVRKHRLCDPFTGMYVPRNKPGEICVITIIGAYECYNVPYDIITKDIPVLKKLQKTLYFSGKKDDEVLFMYTEKRGMHTVHAHDVSYNIKKMSIVGFRGARIRIIECTNESITYEVLNSFPER